MKITVVINTIGKASPKAENRHLLKVTMTEVGKTESLDAMLAVKNKPEDKLESGMEEFLRGLHTSKVSGTEIELDVEAGKKPDEKTGQYPLFINANQLEIENIDDYLSSL